MPGTRSPLGHPTPTGVLALLTIVLCTPVAQSAAQLPYQQPPAAIARILNTPPGPVGAVSPDRKWIVVTTTDPRVTTIAEMAEPTLFLAGLRVKPLPSTRIDHTRRRTRSTT